MTRWTAYTNEAHAEMTMFPLTLLVVAERVNSIDIGTKEDQTRPVPYKAASLAAWSVLSFPMRPT